MAGGLAAVLAIVPQARAQSDVQLPAASAASAPGGPEQDLPVRASPQLEFKVLRAQLTAEGSMLSVRFVVAGASRLPLEPALTYVVNEGSGEKFGVANLVRVGPLAQRRKRPDGSSFMIIDNRHGRLEPGTRISVVVGGLRQEHVVVE